MPDAVLDRHGPTTALAARNGIGLVSPVPWRVRVPCGEGLVRVPVPELADRRIEQGDELRWAVLPQGLPDGVTGVEELPALDVLWHGTATSLDLVLDDGTRLSELDVTDQYGGRLDADDQAADRRTWVDQWNLRRVRLDPAAGRTVTATELVVRASPDRELVVHLDAVGIGPAPVLPADPVDRVRTTRGTHASGRFSRGNTAPLVAVPQGRLFATPVTDADSPKWVYSWHEHGRDGDPRPALQALATSHLPSPWMGERGAFQVMPSPLPHPDPDRRVRALPFDHADEVDRPHRWSARLDGGVEVTLTAGDCVMGVRSTFAGGVGSYVLDHRGTFTEASVERDGDALVVRGLLDDTPGTPPHHVHVRIERALDHDLSTTGDVLRGSVRVEATDGAPVDVLVGLSTLDLDTAAYAVERCGGVDALLSDGARRWSEALGTVEVEGASHDQQVALASGLYRLFLHPTRQDEPVRDGGTRWRSPYGSVLDQPLRAEELGERPETGEGHYSATNGFWDTYRTAWPLLGLLAPPVAGAAAQGFVAHHLDSGWMPRWSAPGAEDCMTGTTSDTVLGDLVVKDVPGIDLAQAYDSALVGASVPAPDEKVGRKGLHPALFRGFVDTDTEEGMSWTLDAALNDWSASRLGARLAGQHPEGSPERERLEAEVEWLTRRSLLYREVFSPDHGMFVGRLPDGTWRVPAEEFEPDEWGHDYTETNAWGTAVTVPHDGAGLAALHGGGAGLSALLDRILTRPETGALQFHGHYPGIIHEMTEARDCRMGMLALSNQPAHHIPFMLMHTGRHDDAHAVVGEALERLFVGSDLGQGYPGDEDNGEMSAWWIFATLGLYPLVPSTGSWVLLPPRVTRSVIRPVEGEPVTITVLNPEEGGRYLRRVWVDGAEWHSISLPNDVLARGAQIEVELSPTPCGWGADSRPVSASELHGWTEPLRDVTGGARVRQDAPSTAGQARAAGEPEVAVEGLVDDTASTAVPLGAGQPVVVELTAPTAVGDLITLSVDRAQTASWRLEHRVAGEWVVVDEREGEEFPRHRQTRVFRVRPVAGPVDAVRLTPTAPLTLRQLEVFAP
ncbi:GH92 family glycosyl hydrolase [Auraticoccus monumenti]|uniref:Alpha-1,2-mannosidase, putative n=1 Tax=Auraticoccus monumenti TaxID=675864 RepID=A0A1G6T7K1_9ACTN|nr:GH92 family glycosyl hydrolase [Auraticoccus monumenti]SDD24546.1 alpha-1,2-mannosidase, putative [Auraticoccus monumenti]